MRTTVDLPPAVHQRARELAEERGVSMSAMVADLATRGLAQLNEPVEIAVHERTGMPLISIGRTITSADVAEFLDDE